MKVKETGAEKASKVAKVPGEKVDSLTTLAVPSLRQVAENASGSAEDAPRDTPAPGSIAGGFKGERWRRG